MQYYVYDIETYPNLFTATFRDLKSKEVLTVEISDRKNEFNKLKNIINTDNLYLIGYNNHMFDDIVIRYMLINKIDKPALIAEFAHYIINSQKDKDYSIYYDPKLKPYLANKYKDIFKSIDLMKIPALDKLKVSLKQVAILLNHEKIQDLPIHYLDNIELDQIDLVLKYNLNDVDITEKLFYFLLPLIKLRKSISEQYNLDVLSSSKTKIAKQILNQHYLDLTGDYEFTKLRTTYDKINIKDCILPQISFNSKPFKQLLSKMAAKSVTKTKGSLDEFMVRYGNKLYQLGAGGLHSVDETAIYESTDDYNIIDCDVGSYYPMLKIKYGIKSNHLGQEILDILNNITVTRLKAKKEGDKTTAETLKILINSIFGLLGEEFYWLKDDKAMLSVTINGQMFLLMLIEQFEDNGIEVISANTDGVTCKVHKDKEQLYYDICKKWEGYTGFELEYAYYNKYVRRDVNNYIVQTKDGKVKEKGVFLRTQEIEKGYRTMIIPKALYEYFINNVPIEDTIYNSTNIFDFIKSQKVGYQYKSVHRLLTEDNRIKDIPLQKNNRYYISNHGGLYMKIKDDGANENLEAGYNVTIFNDYIHHDDFKDYDINYSYYIRECNKIIRQIETKQLTLF
jgi:hypothetical protein